MADEKIRGTFITFQAPVSWARVHPNQREMSNPYNNFEDVGGQYSVQINLTEEQAKEAEAAFLNVKRNKETGAPFINAKRTHLSKSGEEKGPPKLYYSAVEGDGALTPLPEDIEIGNGSLCNVRIFASIYTKPEIKAAKATAKLLGIQVLDLVEYKPGGAVDTSGQKAMFNASQVAKPATFSETDVDEEEVL